MKTIQWRVVATLMAAGALGRACRMRVRQRMRHAQLPLCVVRTPLSAADIQYVFRMADGFVRVMTQTARQRSFFRAFIAGSVLRRNGIPVLLNVGLRFREIDRVDEYCWLSVGGTPLAEPRRVCRAYPDLVACVGEVQYWAGC